MGERTDGRKPLGGRAYGHIAHLPGSRMGPGDHHCHEGQGRICLERVRDRHDEIIVQEKLDGSCVSVAKLLDGEVVILTRAGYLATTSPYEQHHLWAYWARLWEQMERWQMILQPGERIAGEWLAQAHGTRYELPHEPFVAFDLFRTDGKRAPYAEFEARIGGRLVTPRVLHRGGPLSIGAMLAVLEPSGHGALDPVEGAVWRVERRGEVDFLAKYVRPDKVDGAYLETSTGGDAMWNWRPVQEGAAV